MLGSVALGEHHAPHLGVNRDHLTDGIGIPVIEVPHLDAPSRDWVAVLEQAQASTGAVVLVQVRQHVDGESLRAGSVTLRITLVVASGAGDRRGEQWSVVVQHAQAERLGEPGLVSGADTRRRPRRQPEDTDPHRECAALVVLDARGPSRGGFDQIAQDGERALAS